MFKKQTLVLAVKNMCAKNAMIFDNFYEGLCYEKKIYVKHE